MLQNKELLYPKKDLNQMEIDFANDNNIELDLLKNENLKFDPIAKSILLKKIDQFNKQIQSALINENDQFLTIQQKKRHVNDF